MKRIIYCCVAAILASSCGDSEQDAAQTTDADTAKESRIERLSWVLGTWRNETPDGVFTEHWEKTSATLYSGHGMLISVKGDTVFSEHIQLEEVNDTLYYKPVVSGQNDGKETVFTEKTLSADEVVFENPTHDFPQRIIYKRPTDSTLHARIEGTVNGVEQGEDYNFKKAR